MGLNAVADWWTSNISQPLGNYVGDGIGGYSGLNHHVQSGNGLEYAKGFGSGVFERLVTNVGVPGAATQQFALEEAGKMRSDVIASGGQAAMDGSNAGDLTVSAGSLATAPAAGAAKAGTKAIVSESAKEVAEESVAQVSVHLSKSHMAVSVRKGAEEVATHSIVKGVSNSVMRQVERGNAALLNGAQTLVTNAKMFLNEASKTYSIKVSQAAADAAITAQKASRGTKGKFCKGQNSCATHVRDIVRAAGEGLEDFKHNVREGAEEALEKIGFTAN